MAPAGRGREKSARARPRRSARAMGGFHLPRALDAGLIVPAFMAHYVRAGRANGVADCGSGFFRGIMAARGAFPSVALDDGSLCGGLVGWLSLVEVAMREKLV